jgi:hypothetical protein
MKDKQIVIDVTQCPYYREGKFCVYLSYKTKCEGDCNWTSYKEMEEQLKRKEQECERLKEENYKKVWCDMLLNKIEEIAKEKYPNTEYWIDTGSRLNCALEMLDTFKRSLKTKTNPYEYIKGLMPYMGDK